MVGFDGDESLGKISKQKSPNEQIQVNHSNRSDKKQLNAPPKFNIAPEKWWLEGDPLLLGFGNFPGRTVKLR